MKILVTRASGVGGEAGVAELANRHPEVDFVIRDRVEVEEDAWGGVEAVIGRVTGNDLDHAPSVRWVHSDTNGVDWIRRVPALLDRDIVLTNPKGAPSVAMAEHTFGMLLFLMRNLRFAEANRNLRRWKQPDGSSLANLYGAALGIVGLGSIGRAVAECGRAFGMTVRGIDVNLDDRPPWVDEIVPPSDMQSVLAASDVLVVTVPLTRATVHMIGAPELRVAKRGVIVCQLSRGGVVDETALIDHLRSGHVGGACLDVAMQEPMPEDSPLWDFDNVVITAHYAGRSPLTNTNRLEIVSQNVARFLSGASLLNVLDKDAEWQSLQGLPQSF